MTDRTGYNPQEELGLSAHPTPPAAAAPSPCHELALELGKLRARADRIVSNLEAAQSKLAVVRAALEMGR